MASIVCSSVVLLAIFFLLPWLYFLPKCVLAAMSVTFPICEAFFPDRTLVSICLVVFSLLAEAPHDVKYFWKWVFTLVLQTALDTDDTIPQDASMG